jgi:hypothetical protein
MTNTSFLENFCIYNKEFFFNDFRFNKKYFVYTFLSVLSENSSRVMLWMICIVNNKLISDTEFINHLVIIGIFVLIECLILIFSLDYKSNFIFYKFPTGFLIFLFNCYRFALYFRFNEPLISIKKIELGKVK